MLEHYRGNEEFVKRILDLKDLAYRQQRLLITPFLTPQEQSIAQRVIGNALYLQIDGGYEGAEMCRIALSPFAGEDCMGIVILHASYKEMGKRLSHRDVLGAMMHLGIERDQFGDIVLHEQDIYVIVKEELAYFVMQELHQIARTSLSFHIYEGVLKNEQEMKVVTRSISSMRLDCVVAACANISRTKAEALIKGKLVKVDHMPLEDCKCLCNNNSTVSIRGYGRFHLSTTGRMSKKGRYVIEIGTYI